MRSYNININQTQCQVHYKGYTNCLLITFLTCHRDKNARMKGDKQRCTTLVPFGICFAYFENSVQTGKYIENKDTNRAFRGDPTNVSGSWRGTSLRRALVSFCSSDEWGSLHCNHYIFVVGKFCWCLGWWFQNAGPPPVPEVIHVTCQMDNHSLTCSFCTSPLALNINIYSIKGITDW